MAVITLYKDNKKNKKDSKGKETYWLQIPGQIEKLLNQVKKSSGRASLSPEALQVKYKADGLFLAVTTLCYRATWF